MIREARVRVIMVGAMVRVMHSTPSNWFDSNLLTLNAEKSNYILFRTKHKQINYTGKVMIDGNEIKKISNTEYLGVFLADYLDSNLH